MPSITMDRINYSLKVCCKDNNNFDVRMMERKFLFTQNTGRCQEC